jgi:hypothetical protein
MCFFLPGFKSLILYRPCLSSQCQKAQLYIWVLLLYCRCFYLKNKTNVPSECVDRCLRLRNEYWNTTYFSLSQQWIFHLYCCTVHYYFSIIQYILVHFLVLIISEWIFQLKAVHLWTKSVSFVRIGLQCEWVSEWPTYGVDLLHGRN